MVVWAQGNDVARLVRSLFGKGDDVMRLKVSLSIRLVKRNASTKLTFSLRARQNMPPHLLVSDVAACHAPPIFGRIVAKVCVIDVINRRKLTVERMDDPRVCPKCAFFC